jgi:histidinol-phosphate aminotransferase
MSPLALDANLGPLPPAALARTVADLDPDALRRYPDRAPLEAALAARFGLSPARVVVTAGGDDAIDRTCRVRLGPGRELLRPEPSFEMLDRFASLAGGTTRTVPWPDGQFPLDAFLAAIGASTGVIAVVSPNNPTGAVATATDLRHLAVAAPTALVLLDHAYVEYAATDLTPAGLELPNVVVVRTLSKAWGLAGCRVGYALGSERVVAALRRAGAPYPVAAPSLALALARLSGGEAEVCAHVERVRQEREALVRRLTGLGLEPLPSEANFVLAECGPRFDRVLATLTAHGVMVRSFPGRPGLATALRISLPGAAAPFERLLDALGAAAGPGGRP